MFLNTHKTLYPSDPTLRRFRTNCFTFFIWIIYCAQFEPLEAFSLTAVAQIRDAAGHFNLELFCLRIFDPLVSDNFADMVVWKTKSVIRSSIGPRAVGLVYWTSSTEFSILRSRRGVNLFTICAVVAIDSKRNTCKRKGNLEMLSTCSFLSEMLVSFVTAKFWLYFWVDQKCCRLSFVS